MDQLKHAPDPYINFALLSTIGFLPAGLAKKAAALFGDKASGVLTNVPGPRQALYLAGEEIKNFMFWVPRSGKIGLGISILSYNGKVTVGVACDEKRMPDPEVLLDGFEDEFNHLVQLVQSGKIDEDPLVLNDRYAEAQATADDNPLEKPAHPPAKCCAITQSGRQCKNLALAGLSYCAVHRNQASENQQVKDIAEIMRALAE